MKKLEDLAKFPSENPNPVLRVTENKVLYVNKTGELLLSIKEGDKIPKLFQSELTEAFNKNILKTLEVEIDNLSYILDIAPIKEEGYANIYGRNITDLKTTENALIESEKTLKDIIEAIPIGIIISNPEGMVTEINSQVFKIFGYDSKKEFLKIPAIDHYYNSADRDLFVRRLESGLVNNFELKYKRKDGTIFWGSITSIAKEIGNQLIYINAIQDITDRKKIEEEVADLAKFPEENPNPVLRVSKEFVLYANQTGQDLFNIKIGNKIPILLRDITHKTFEENVTQNLEVVLNNHFYSLFITPIKGAKYINIYGRDITERRYAEIELQKSEATYHEAYNRAEFYKDVFTHDINNILQNISNGIQLNELYFNMPDKSEKIKRNINMVKKQIIRGATLVSNIRKLSKLTESESILFNTDLLSVLNKNVAYIKNAFVDKNVKIQVDAIENNYRILANELLEDVFENILTNSINYNDSEVINIEVKVTKELSQGINYIKMQFIDNGIGITDERKQQIFIRGYSEKTSIHGMGLGLSLVKKIIASYNGEIWMEDRVKDDRTKGNNCILLIPEVINNG